MAFTVRCNTLFDITQTGIISRRNANNEDPTWILKRNQQCNFDTIIQAISLRSQPENITAPTKHMLLFNQRHNFGLLFDKSIKTKISYWTFDFDIHYANVYNNGINELGHLHNDCDKIPMIKCKTEWSMLPNYLDTDSNTRNIYFEVIKNAG
jgi:hypothetical protein